MDTPPSPPFHPNGRPRGGQPGNRNALKHGLYSTGDGRPAPNGIYYLDSGSRRGFYGRLFKESELSGLEDYPLLDLKGEIQLLRVFIRRILTLAKEVADLAAAIKLLRTLSLAVASLARLVKTRFLLSAPGDGVSRAISQALAELNHELSQAEPDPSELGSAELCPTEPCPTELCPPTKLCSSVELCPPTELCPPCSST